MQYRNALSGEEAAFSILDWRIVELRRVFHWAFLTCGNSFIKANFILDERMKPSEALASNRAAIRQVVESHRARNARVFGSVLRGQDTDNSDLDILIDPTPETTLMDVAAIQAELQRLLGVPVDVLTPKALPDAVRSRILSEAVPV